MAIMDDYRPVPGEEQQFLSPNTSSEHLGVRHKSRLPAIKTVVIIGLVISNLCSVALLIFSGRLSSSSTTYGTQSEYTTTKNLFLKQTSNYSPYLDKVEVPIRDAQLDGTFLGLNNSDNIFKQAPSPEVDAAWNRLYKFNFIILKEDEVRKLGKDPRYAAKAPKSWGYGDNAYMSRTDVAHRIHCLNMLRRATYPEHVYSHLRDGEEATRVLWRPHVMHCTHMLLQHLMCTATLEAVTYNWMETMPNPQPDFSITKKCTDLEAILEWQEREGVDVRKHPWMAKDLLDSASEDHLKIPVPEEYLLLFNSTSKSTRSNSESELIF